MRAIGSDARAVRREVPRTIVASAARLGPTPGRDRVRTIEAPDFPERPVTRHPCGVDPEAVEHWPWNVPAVTQPSRVLPDSVAVETPPAEEPVTIEPPSAPLTLPTGRIDDVVVFCTALGCTNFAARVTRKTHPAFADLCERHRHTARERVGMGGEPSMVAYRLRMGANRPGRPRSAA